MRTGRPKATLIVTDDERQLLQSLAHRSRTASFAARTSRESAGEMVRSVMSAGVVRSVAGAVDDV